MAKYEKRTAFAHYINTTPDSSDSDTWVLEGIGVSALSLEYNPQVDQFKTIISDNADASFTNYQIQSSISDKKIDKSDAIWTKLNEIRTSNTCLETELLEIDMTSDSPYNALKYNILIVINSFLGEEATISYDIYIKGTPEKGTATITSGTPTFTPTA